MAKIYCTECGKPTEKPYYIDGKPYGYTCYKREMAIRLAKMKLAEQEEKMLNILVNVSVQWKFSRTKNRDVFMIQSANSGTLAIN